MRFKSSVSTSTFATSPAEPLLFVALMTSSFSPARRNFFTSTVVGCCQSGFFASALPLRDASAPLSQVYWKVAVLSPPSGIVNFLRKVRRSSFWPVLEIQSHSGSASDRGAERGRGRRQRARGRRSVSWSAGRIRATPPRLSRHAVGSTGRWPAPSRSLASGQGHSARTRPARSSRGAGGKDRARCSG